MSHNKSERQLNRQTENMRSVWVYPADGGFEVCLKHGLRVERREMAATRDEAGVIAERMIVERGAAAGVNWST